MKSVTCLLKQLGALSLLFQDNETYMWLIRGMVSVEVFYIFGDALGSGFGDSWTEEDAVGFRFGVWNK